MQRHEQSFYSFVHKVHSKGQGLFDSLMGWIELFLNFAREGLPREVDLEVILPYAGSERLAIMKECDEVAAYYYKLKVAHEEKIRRRFQKDGASEEEAAFINGIVASLNMNDSIVNDAGEAAADGESSDDEDDDSDAEEAAASAFDPTKDNGAAQWKSVVKDDDASTSSDRTSVHQSVQSEVSPLSGGSVENKRSSMDRIRNSLDFSRKTEAPTSAPAGPAHPQPQPKIKRRRRSKRGAQEVAVAPTLKHLPSLVPIFMEMVRQKVVMVSDSSKLTIVSAPVRFVLNSLSTQWKLLGDVLVRCCSTINKFVYCCVCLCVHYP